MAGGRRGLDERRDERAQVLVRDLKARVRAFELTLEVVEDEEQRPLREDLREVVRQNVGRQVLVKQLLQNLHALRREVLVQPDHHGLRRERAARTVERVDALEALLQTRGDVADERSPAYAADAVDYDRALVALEYAVSNLSVLAPPAVKAVAQLRQDQVKTEIEIRRVGGVLGF